MYIYVCTIHKKISCIPMLSSACLNISHVWVQRLEGIFGVRVGTKRARGNGAVDAQLGTGVEGGSHPCTKGCHPK
jgi:hypothetical protein